MARRNHRSAELELHDLDRPKASPTEGLTAVPVRKLRFLGFTGPFKLPRWRKITVGVHYFDGRGNRRRMPWEVPNGV